MKNKIIEFIKSFDNEIEVTFKDNAGMYCYIEDKEINVDIQKFFRNDMYEKMVNRAYKKLHKQKGVDLKISTAMYGILHEIGHILSSDNYTDDAYEFDETMRYAILRAKLNPSNKLKRYMQLPFEIDADNMALEIYKIHEDEIITLDKYINTL